MLDHSASTDPMTTICVVLVIALTIALALLAIASGGNHDLAAENRRLRRSLDSERRRRGIAPAGSQR